MQKEVDGLKALGVKVETNMVIGRTADHRRADEENGFEAVFIGSGAGLPSFMHIPGENLKGVYSANEFLTRINLMKAYREDSDTPIMDCRARSGRRRRRQRGHGRRPLRQAPGRREVCIVYRRGMAELPARQEEVEHAKEEGIIFKTLTNPIQIHGDENGCVKSMTCVEMELGEPDASGRRRPIVRGQRVRPACGYRHHVLGTSPNPLIKKTTPDLRLKRGGITKRTTAARARSMSMRCCDGAQRTVILAMGAGKKAAQAILGRRRERRINQSRRLTVLAALFFALDKSEK